MTPFNPDTAGLSELRDECARLLGWTRHEDDYWTRPNGDDRGYSSRDRHPCPATLDFVAGAMPQHWEAGTQEHKVDLDPSDYSVEAIAWRINETDERWTISCTGSTELLARYRLLVKVLAADGKVETVRRARLEEGT